MSFLLKYHEFKLLYIYKNYIQLILVSLFLAKYFMFTHTCTYMYVCMYVCMHVFVCVCEYSPRVVAWILLLIKVRKFCSISRMGYGGSNKT